MNLGICAFPLSKGVETGRGLERVIAEFCNYLDNNKIKYDFYHKGIIKNEFLAIFNSFSYLYKLKDTKNKVYLAIYPVAGFFPSLINKKPLITLCHDLIPFLVYGFDNYLKYSIKRYCIKYSLKKSDCIIVPFESTKEKLIELFNIDKDKIFVIPYGINHKNYYIDKNIQKIKYKISFLGEAKRSKGVDSVIKAFQIIQKKIPQAKLHIASGGNEINKMKNLAKKILPQDSYVFEGFIKEENMREFYNSSHIFIFPSRYGFGLSVLESMACGTPAIIGNTLDAKDFIDDNSLLVNPEDINEIAEKSINLLLNQNIYNEKIKQGLIIANKYSWENMSKKYYEICSKFL